jgi:hypothetical protein
MSKADNSVSTLPEAASLSPVVAEGAISTTYESQLSIKGNWRVTAFSARTSRINEIACAWQKKKNTIRPNVTRLDEAYRFFVGC